MAQAPSRASSQFFSLSAAGGGSGNSMLRYMGPGGSGHPPGPLGQWPSSGIGCAWSYPRKGTAVVEPLPASQTVTDPGQLVQWPRRQKQVGVVSKTGQLHLLPARLSLAQSPHTDPAPFTDLATATDPALGETGGDEAADCYLPLATA